MKAVLDPRIGHTIVLQRQDEDPLERVLVATPNRKALPLAADVATHLPGRSHRREITVLLFDHGVQAEEPDDAIPAAVGADAGRGGPARSSASVRYETFSGSLSDAVAVRTGDYDRVLVGRSRGLYSRTFGPIPAGILRRCRCPVLFVSSVRTGAGTRARGGRRS